MNRKPIFSALYQGRDITHICRKHSYKSQRSNKRMRLFNSLLLGLLLALFFSTASFGQCTLTCDDEKHISLSPKGYAVIIPELVLNGDFSCAGPITVTVFDENNQPIGDTVRCEHVGKTFKVGVKSASTGLDCWSSILVEDKLVPKIHCADTMIACTASLLPKDLGYPNVTDNCETFDSTDLKYFDLFTELPCGSTHNGQAVNARVTRSWTILDKHGNVGTCTQNIYLLKENVSNIVFPPHKDGINGPAISCTNGDVDNLAITGAPTINGQPVQKGDACKLFVRYQDDRIEVCPPASFRIIRRWEVTDICTQEVRVSIQNILVVDNNPPVLSCPDSFSVFSNVSNCGATVILPQATATDSCSDVTVQPNWEFGTGYGPFYNVPVGVHNITYMATDKCGNTASCTTKVAIIDNVQPIAICRDEVHIGLTNNGYSEIDAATFDSGSKDNCGITKWEITRDSVFGPNVRFTCADVNKPVEIILRVYDKNGLNNECRTRVIVNDESKPAISCPPDITIACSSDYKDTSITGVAIAADDCGIERIYFEDIESINTCKVGSVSRTWYAVDSAGNTATCLQMIFIEDKTPFSVVFPEDYSTNQCGASIHPDVTGRPKITGNDCESLLISHQDEVFLVGDSACMKILRTWSVLDWCNFDPKDSTNSSKVTAIQLIKVIDIETPVITNCLKDTTVGIHTFACETRVELADLVATDCNKNLTITNNSPYADSSGPNASGMYPIGTHDIRFIVSDGCGNSTSCEMRITVEDQHAPTPVCKYGLTISLTEGGFVTLPANAINSGSYDNCSDPSELIYEVTPNYFTCEDTGRQTLNLIVTDKYGNSQFCSTDIFIQDNGDYCNPNSMTAIGGRIFTEDGSGMEEVSVQITGGKEEMGYTDAEGKYIFEDLSKTETYTVRPMTTGAYNEGISTFDLVLIRKHILGIAPLPSPYKILAADVNNSKTISTFDMVLIRQVVLGTRTDFPNNPSWRYIDASYQFPDPRNPFIETVPEFRNYKKLLINDLNRDFIAFKVGDVNNSASPTAMVGTARDAKSTFQFELTDLEMEAGFEYRIPFKAKDLNQIQGYQFTLNFDQQSLQFKEVIAGEPMTMGPNNFGLMQIEQGLITTSWENAGAIATDAETILFTVVFEAKQKAALKEAIHVSSRITAAEAYNDTDELMKVGLRFSKEKTKRSLKLYQNFPNPFENKTIIAFTLPKSTEGNISIHDTNGRLLKSYYGKYAQGYNEIEIDLSDIHIQTGVLYYHLQTPITRRLSKKMVFIRE